MCRLNPKTFSRMRSNVEANTDTAFYPINAALCGENKSFDVQLGDGGLCDNIYGKDIVDGEPCRVVGKTFDTICEEVFSDDDIDLCKIDIEGAEFEVFRSVTFDRLARCRYLLIEIHHDANRDRTEIIERLGKNNFEEVGGKRKTMAGITFISL